MGLTFSYPFNGQQDVVLDSQMVIDFAGDISGSMDDALELQVDGATAQPGITVQQDDNQANILRLIPDADLLPNTTYSVVATRTISGGNTGFNAGQTLFQFTTRPLEGRPAADGFSVSEVTPGETNPVTNETSLFTQFNAIRVVLSEAVDPATVNGNTFTVTGPGGAVTDARLTALGRYITFDPVDDLAPGDYTVAWTDAIISKFGNPLTAGSATRTVLSTGTTATENLRVEPSATDVADLPDNNLNGLAVNNVNISSQLIGSNDQPTSAAPTRTGVLTTLAQPGLPGYGNVFPAVIRAGQKFQLTGLKLFLNGDIATPINPSGPIDVNFINDVSVYLQANDYRNIEAPTAVRLRFDLGIGTLITAAAGSQQSIIQSLANGVFNQSALNIQAAGLAIPQDNGDLMISSLGTFPINVNRTDNATVDFQLTLTLPAGDQAPVQADQIGPIITAQSPSACLYAFGSPGYNAFYASAAPTAFPEVLCILPLNGQQPPAGGLGLSINSFPIESSPAITFSEPLDPTSVNGQSIQLTGGGATVPATYSVEGFSVVIDPDGLLAPSTPYQITLNAGATLTDLAGNAVTFDNTFGPGQTIAFTTEPLVATNPTPPLLSTLSPGVPCAVEGGDFTTGGDNAGHCAGDAPGNDADGNAVASDDFPVFQNPANVTVDGFFSKLVSSDSIVLADGCLVNGSGNTVANATVAVQEMDGGGQCVGAVPGRIAIGNPGDALTRAFSFRPVNDFEAGTRYWIVICGTDGSACTNRIADADGNALNTTPLLGTGSTAASTGAAGGPDVIMPFDAVAASPDYYTNTFTLPESDTNGNGRFDDGENAQAGNRSLVALAAAGAPLAGEQPDGRFASYLSLTRPIAIRGTLDACGVLDAVTDDDGNSAVGETPEQCIQVSLLPGGFNALTSINIGTDALTGALTGLLSGVSAQSPLGDDTPVTGVPILGDVLGGLLGPDATVGAAIAGADGIIAGILGGAGLGGLDEPLQTGRILLRFPNASADDTAGGVTQSGYIVERCTGTLPSQSGGDPIAYDFEPCFAASLDLVANAPDGQGIALAQQTITANLVGPVTFEQNGRLIISLRNVNTLSLNATALGLLPAAATIDPAGLNFQISGSPTHGAREFPNR